MDTTLLSDASALLPSGHSAPPVRRSHIPAAASCSSSPVCSAPPSQLQPVSRPAAPLPLHSSHSLVPPPLKFLWFRGSQTQRHGSETLESSSDLLSEATLFDRLDEIDDAVWACTCREDSDSQTQPADSYRGQKDDVDNVVVSALSVSAGEDSSSVESFKAPATKSDQQTQAALGGAAKGWISRFLDLKSFWKDLKSEQSCAVDLLSGAKSEHVESDILDKAHQFASICDLPGCLLEEAHERVFHNRESVSAFLQDVPVFEMKTIRHLCSLSSLAYVIPRINTRELFKHHRLRLITSSLEKKAEAIAQAKDRSTGKQRGVGCKDTKVLGDSSAVDVGESDPAGAAKSGTLMPPMNAEHTPAIESAGGTILQEAGMESNNQCTRDFSQVEPVTSSSMPTNAEVEAKKSSTNTQTSPVGNCPCEWFICDDEGSHIRYLIVQGSESLASWQTNLAIDPTTFEELGILVHRGVYEAAKGLYEIVLPEILDHLRAHGELAQFRFTGHSLGGSLTTLVALMLVIRGVIRPSSLLPVVSFGAPYVLCGGDYLLQMLNMKKNNFLSVVMHRDIVPRAFACDYPDHIAQILKRLNGTFREHPCLTNQKLLYAPMGQMLILQPHPTHSPGHPLLPSGVGFYYVRHPSNEQDRSSAIELADAQRAFMNMPHPLELLRDPGAYGSAGAISRDHDPRSYARAMEVVTRMGQKKMRRKHRDWRRQLLWPLVTADASLLAQKAGVNTDTNVAASGAASPALSKSKKGRREMVACATAERCEFSRSSIGLSRSRTNVLNRYARLIASRHVQVGLLLIFSSRMINLAMFSSVLDWI